MMMIYFTMSLNLCGPLSLSSLKYSVTTVMISDFIKIDFVEKNAAEGGEKMGYFVSFWGDVSFLCV